MDGQRGAPGAQSAEVMDHVRQTISPTVAACGPMEAQGLLTALEGKFVPRPLRRADARAAGCFAHGAKFLFGGQPRRAHTHRLGLGMEIGQSAD